MNITQMVFSPTGGTQKVADILTSKLCTGEVKRCDLSFPMCDYSAIRFAQNDLALIAVPSFGGRVPELAAKKLLQFSGAGARCVLVCVYGNRAYDDTLIELKDLAEKCGFKVVAAVCAVAEHSIMHQFATGRPDELDRKQLESYAEKIAEKFKAGGEALSSVPGDRPYKKYGGVGMVPKSNKDCSGCGLCAENCPAEAIDTNSINVADPKKCISCMRCVVQCPQSARRVNPAVVAAAALAMKKACSGRKQNELFI